MLTAEFVESRPGSATRGTYIYKNAAGNVVGFFEVWKQTRSTMTPNRLYVRVPGAPGNLIARVTPKRLAPKWDIEAGPHHRDGVEMLIGGEKEARAYLDKWFLDKWLHGNR